MIPLDPRKYFIAGLVLLLLASAGTAFVYRASYHVEQARRQEVEVALKQTSDALVELTKSSKAALDAVTRASIVTRTLADQRRSERERVLAVPSDQDGPVSPVLRDAVNGVR